MNFTDHDLTVISNALRVAADCFAINERTIADVSRLANQFTRQRDEALALYDRIAEETGVAS